MTVRTMEQQATQAERIEGLGLAKKAKEIAASIMAVAAPCFRWTGLDYLDPTYRASTSAEDKARTDADLHRAQANF